MLAGCGDNSVNVNVDGNYKDTTKEAFSTYVAQIDEAKNLDAKVAQSGDTAKYHLTVSIDDKEEGYSISGDMYYVFKNGKFDGLKIILSSSSRGVSIDATIDMISYDGTIDFPSFDEYIETGV